VWIVKSADMFVRVLFGGPGQGVDCILTDIAVVYNIDRGPRGGGRGQLPKSELVYEGALQRKRYTRFMLVGRK
jgi:hypothetical protein